MLAENAIRNHRTEHRRKKSGPPKTINNGRQLMIAIRRVLKGFIKLNAMAFCRVPRMVLLNLARRGKTVTVTAR